jgi:hypothetical protein
MRLLARSTCGFAPQRSVCSAALALLALLPTGAARAGDRLGDNLAWVPHAEVSLATTLLGQPDYVGNDNQSAKTWAMHKIAVIQAARGDVAGAKNTVAQIGYQGAVGEVSGVWFVNGQPVYDRPPTGYACPAAPGPLSYSLSPAYNYDGSIVPGLWLENGQPIMFCGGACGPGPAYPTLDPPMPADPAASMLGPYSPAQPQSVAAPPSSNSEAGGLRASANAVGSDRTTKRVSFKIPSDLPPTYLTADPVHGAVVDFYEDRDSRGTRVTMRKYADGHAVIETL